MHTHTQTQRQRKNDSETDARMERRKGCALSWSLFFVWVKNRVHFQHRAWTVFSFNFLFGKKAILLYSLYNRYFGQRTKFSTKETIICVRRNMFEKLFKAKCRDWYKM